MVITLFVKSCSPTPEPIPISKKKIKSPSWTNGISLDYKKWYGVGQTSISDTTKLRENALLFIKDQVLLDIKKKLNNGFDFEQRYQNSIAKQIIDSRLDIINSLTKVDSTFSNSNEKYVLVSMNKDVYSLEIEDRLNSFNLEKLLTILS